MYQFIEKMEMDLQLRGYSTRTQDTYIKHIKRFAKFFNKPLINLCEDDVREYLHHIISVRKLSCSYVNSAYSAIKFFYEITLGLDWNMKNIPRIKKVKKLPTILSYAEIKRIFDVTSNLKHKSILMTTYSAGLRVSEVAHLKVSHIDSSNMQIFVSQGKGNKDRYSLLGNANLSILRKYYKIFRPGTWLFPNDLTGNPLTTRTIQKVFKDATRKAGISKDVSIHSLRHSFATHLIKSGVDLCTIQKLLGHTNIQTTSIYLHLSNKDVLSVLSPLDTLVGDFNA